MNANVIIAVAAVAVTLFTVIFIVVENQMGYDDDVLYYGTATGGGHSFTFAKTAMGPFIGYEEPDVGSILVASVENGGSTEEGNAFAKIVWNSDGTLQQCDVDPTATQEAVAEWVQAPSPGSGLGFTDPVTGVEFTYTVIDGVAPEGTFKTMPTPEECNDVARATFEAGRERFLAEAMDDADRSLSSQEGRMAVDSYNRCTHETANACVLIDGCRFAFRGSDDIWDWWSNIAGSLWSWRINGQNMHGGFVTEFFRLKDQINTSVGRCGHPRFIGHSLGGAMANVAWQYYRKGSVYTYGAPASFNGRARRFGGVRMWHDADPVPSWAAAFGRHHAHGSTKLYSACTRRDWWGWCTRHDVRKTGSGYDSKSWVGGDFGAHSSDQYKNFS